MTTPQSFRDGLPVAQTHTYLNTAATSPTHETVRSAMAAYEDERARRGELSWDDWMDAIEGVRQATSWFFECKPEEVALLKNTSDAINAVAGSIPWKRGDEVVTTDQEFPSNLLPWRRLERQGVTVHVVRSNNGILEEGAIEHALSQRTRLLALSQVMYSTGQRMDVKRLASAAHRVGAEVLVDTIQATGAVNTQFSHWGIDYLACGGHKWIMAPFGVGVLVIRKEIIKEREPAAVGWFGLEDNENYSLQNTRLASTARRFEIGNLNLGGWAGWRAALGGLASVPAREERVIKLSGRLVDRLRSEGLKPVTPSQPNRRAGIVSVPLKEPLEAVLALRKKLIVTADRGPYLRFSTHFWNTEEEIDAAARALKEHLEAPDRGSRDGGRGRPHQRTVPPHRR